MPYKKQSLKGSQRSNGFGVFNDTYRDAIKGDTDSYGIGYIQGNFYLKTQIEEGIAGSINYDEKRMGFADYASESINYFNCHDNLILYDKLIISIKDLENIDNYIKLALTLIMLSFGKPFLYEGNEFNHSKNNDRNSYNSPLFINAINWQEKKVNVDIFNYTKNLIDLRKSLKVFNKVDPEDIRNSLTFMNNIDDSLIIYKIKADEGYILVAINASKEDKYFDSKEIGCFTGYRDFIMDKIFDKKGKCNIRSVDLNLEKLSVNVYKIY